MSWKLSINYINKDILIGNILAGIKEDLEYIWYGILPDFYYEHIHWRIRQLIYHESCKNCRAWTYKGRRIKNGCPVMYGTCAWDKLSSKPIDWTSENEYCHNYNELPYDEKQYTKLGDGWHATTMTPTGKEITIVSKNGRWLYLHDGPE